MSNIISKIEEVVSPILQELNLDLVDVEYVKEGRDWFLRIYIDTPNGGIDIEQCAQVSEKLSEKLDVEEGKKVVFDKVLMSNGVVGNPYVEGAQVEGVVLKNGKGKKLTIFTYKPNKTSTRKKQGHRQPYTTIKIVEIK